VPNSDINISAADGFTGDTVLATCGDGYATLHGFSLNFTIECIGVDLAESEWNVTDECVAVACPPLSIPGQSGFEINGYTGGSEIGTHCGYGYECNNCYQNLLFVYCEATGPGTADWRLEGSCDGLACPALSINNSDSVNMTGRYPDIHLVTCEDGYTDGASNQFNVSCSVQNEAEADWTFDSEQSTSSSEKGEDSISWGSSEYIPTCTAVACPTLTVTNSDTLALNGSTGSTHSVTCADGYGAEGSGSFTATCAGVPSSPGNATSQWTALTCEGIYHSFLNLDPTLVLFLCLSLRCTQLL